MVLITDQCDSFFKEGTQTLFRTLEQQLKKEHTLAYYEEAYLHHQSYDCLLSFEEGNSAIHFSVEDGAAVSLSQAPFGSFYGFFDEHSFESCLSQIKSDLSSKGVKSIVLRHPASVYDPFISQEQLLQAGFTLQFEDVNQHIQLSSDWEHSIHKMQRRKLNTLKEEGFYFRKMEGGELQVAHQFLTLCRQAQGLQINISWNLLHRLYEDLPGRYECFGVFRNEKISALCIALRVTETIAYYYLPATSPMFRSQSPMVLLLEGMVDYYRNQGFRYLDLGVSSVQGTPQETLRTFKERMGAVERKKPTMVCGLTHR